MNIGPNEVWSRQVSLYPFLINSQKNTRQNITLCYIPIENVVTWYFCHMIILDINLIQILEHTVKPILYDPMEH